MSDETEEDIIATLCDTNGVATVSRASSLMPAEAPDEAEVMVEYTQGGDGEQVTKLLIRLMDEMDLVPCGKTERGPKTTIYMAEPGWWHLGEVPEDVRMSLWYSEEDKGLTDQQGDDSE